MQLITISSVVASSVDADKLQVVARWKNTDKRPIAAANSARAIILPANIWKEDKDVKGIENPSLALFLADAVEELAVSYLRTVVEDSNWLRTEVPMEHFTLSSLLQWNSEQAAISGRLTGDTIKAWATDSITIRTVSQKHGKEIAAALTDQFIRLASPNHGLSPEKAEKLLTNIWQKDDADSTTGLRVQLRLQAIRDKQQAIRANALDSIL